MYILGLSYDFHDSTASLMRDGELIGVAAEERFSLQKHDSNYPHLAIDALLKSHGLKSGDLDAVAYYERPAAKYTRILTFGLAGFPLDTGRFINSNRSWLREKLWVRTSLCSRLDVAPRKIHLLPHHHSHLAQAFLASPYDNAAILVLDGVGEWDCTTLAVAEKRSADGLKIIEHYEYPNSIGLLYAAFTAYLGFKPNSGEASTMALAAFGTPRYVEEIRRIFGLRDDGSYVIDTTYFDFQTESHQPWSARTVDTLGPPREYRQPWGFDALADRQTDISTDDQRCADIAASLQYVLAETLLGLCRRLRRSTQSPNLCMAGGVALNCLANSRVMQESGFENFFIPPDPGDGGASFGAAMLLASDRFPVNPLLIPYLGSEYAQSELLPLVGAAPDMAFLVGRETMGARMSKRIEHAVFDDETLLLDEVAADLALGNIVAWVQGRFEVGPRALGNRSLLVDPGRLDALRRMSQTVKRHSRFRPYALSIAEEDAGRILDTPFIAQPVMKWMQTVWPVREAYRARLRGATHIDGTTRPQVCSRADNPRYWALLRRFGQHSGIAALLNTSLNERSLPMAAYPGVALAMFARTGIDTLVIGNQVLRKRY